MRFPEREREYRLPDFSCVDDVVLSCESKKDLSDDRMFC